MTIRLPWLTGSLLGCLLFLGGRALAQGYHVDMYQHLGQNPGNLNQDLEVVPANVWSPVGWTEVYRYSQNTPSSISSMSRGIPLLPGFAFRFNGQPVTAIRAFRGAFITMDTAQTSITYLNDYLPSLLAPDRIVWLGTTFAANATAQSRILIKTFGTAPHRQVWVQWNNHQQATSNGTTGPLAAFGSIVLEETTNRIHCIVQRMYWWSNARTILNLGIQLNSTTAWVTDSLQSRYAHQGDPRPTDNLIFTFEPGPRHPFDLAIGAVRVPEILPSPAGAPTPVRGMVVNRGTQPLVGWQVAYRVGAGAIARLAPTTQPLAPGDTAQFAFPSGWVRSASGAHTLQVWVSTAAAQPDGNAANDTLATAVQVATRDVPQRLVQEIATSSTCPPCVIFHDSLRAHNRRHPNDPVERIAYPMNFPGAGDPYYLTEFRTRMQTSISNIRNVIILNQVGAPLMVLAGGTVADPTNRFFQPPLMPYAAQLQASSSPTAPLALAGTLRVGGDTIQGTVTLDPLITLPAREFSLQLVLTERRTTGNASTNGETEFLDVAKKILLTRLLMAPLVPGQPLTVPYQYVLPAGHTVEHMDSLEVVAFVQHTMLMASSAPAVAVQAVRLRQASVLGQPAAAAVSPLTLAPNPATGTTTVRFSLASPDRPSIDVLDALGRLVLRVPPTALLAGSHAVPLALAGMRPGWYCVRLTAGGTTQVRRLVVE